MYRLNKISFRSELKKGAKFEKKKWWESGRLYCYHKSSVQAASCWEFQKNSERFWKEYGKEEVLVGLMKIWAKLEKVWSCLCSVN